MATHSSILDWKILWTEEPGGLQSMGLQGIRHDGAHMHAHKVKKLQAARINNKCKEYDKGT